MGEISIYYDELEQAEKTAGRVAKRLDDYRNELVTGVLRKLDNYKGDHNGNISSALSDISSKARTLSTEQSDFEEFASGSGVSISRVKQECEYADEQAAKYIDGIGNSLKEMYFESSILGDIADSIGCWIVEQVNKHDWLRWLKDGFVGVMEKGKDLLADIKYWYQYRGGENFLKGIGEAILVTGIAVAGAVATIVGAPVIVAVAAIAGATIALANFGCNLINEGRALAEYDDNPGLAKRIHDENTIQDTIRGETTKDIASWDRFAKGIDIADFVCTAVTGIYSVGKLGQSFLKWGGGSGNLISQGKTAISKACGNGKGLMGKFRQDGLWQSFKNAFKYMKQDFIENMKFSYAYKHTDFYKNLYQNASNESEILSSTSKIFYTTGNKVLDRHIKYSAGAAKNWMSLSQDLLTGDFSLSDSLKKTAFNFSAYSLNGGYDGESKTFGDWKDGGSKIKELFDTGTGFFKDNSITKVETKIPDNPIPHTAINFSI